MPAVGEGGQVHGAQLRGQQIGRHRGHGGAFFPGTCVLVEAGLDVLHQRLLVGLVWRVFLVEPEHGRSDAFGNGPGLVQGGALGHQYPGFEYIAVDFRHGFHAHMAAGHQPHRTQQCQQHGGQYAVAEPDGAVGQLPHFLPDVFKTVVEGGTKAGRGLLAPFAQAAFQVVGQYPESFDQRGGQGGNQHHWQYLQHRSQLSGQKRQRDEHGHRGQEGGQHPGQDLLGSFGSRLQRAVAVGVPLAMLSVITTESSITIPMAMSRATRVIMFRDSPVRAITTKAPAKAAGRPNSAQKARRGRKNRAITRPTSTRPVMPLPTSICRRSFTIEVMFWVISSSTLPPRRAFSSSIKASRESITRRASSWRFLWISRTMARWPLKSTRSSSRSWASVMVAMSPSVSTAPAAPPITGSSARACRERRSSTNRSWMSWLSVSMVPRGMSRFWLLMARAISRTPRPYWRSRSRDTSMCHWRWDRPTGITSATPSMANRRSSSWLV